MLGAYEALPCLVVQIATYLRQMTGERVGDTSAIDEAPTFALSVSEDRVSPSLQ